MVAVLLSPMAKRKHGMSMDEKRAIMQQIMQETVCVCACVRACVRACVCVRATARSRTRICVRLRARAAQKEVYNLKELEKLGGKAGIVVQTVKDVVQSLVDDGIIEVRGATV